MNIGFKRAFTHGGVFHADDVFATALLLYIKPDLEICRGYQVPEDFDGLVYDIGFGKYDHHQENRRVRKNGVPYAAFGLLWEEFGSEILGEKEARKFDEDFVQPMDLADNTGLEHLLSLLIADRNPSWKERMWIKTNGFLKRSLLQKEYWNTALCRSWQKKKPA